MTSEVGGSEATETSEMRAGSEAIREPNGGDSE
jgi:hypothetical protein